MNQWIPNALQMLAHPAKHISNLQSLCSEPGWAGAPPAHIRGAGGHPLFILSILSLGLCVLIQKERFRLFCLSRSCWETWRPSSPTAGGPAPLVSGNVTSLPPPLLQLRESTSSLHELICNREGKTNCFTSVLIQFHTFLSPQMSQLEELV